MGYAERIQTMERAFWMDGIALCREQMLLLLMESSLSGPGSDSGQDIGVQNIIADIVHGALVQALTVFAAVVVAVRLLVLPVGTKCQGPAAVRAFH